MNQQPLIILPRVEGLECYTRIALRQFPKYENILSAAFAREEIGVADTRQSVASFRGYMSHCDLILKRGN